MFNGCFVILVVSCNDNDFLIQERDIFQECLIALSKWITYIAREQQHIWTTRLLEKLAQKNTLDLISVPIEEFQMYVREVLELHVVM